MITQHNILFVIFKNAAVVHWRHSQLLEETSRAKNVDRFDLCSVFPPATVPPSLPWICCSALANVSAPVKSETIILLGLESSLAFCCRIFIMECPVRVLLFQGE